MIAALADAYPVARLCAVLQCARSTAYYPSQRSDETRLLLAVEQHLLRYPYHGYRMVTAHLQRQGWAVGTTVVRRVLKQLGHTRRVGVVRIQTTDSRHPHPRYPNRIKGLTLVRPDQVWVGDITYIRLGRRFIYLAVILDAYTRAVRGWHLSERLTRQLTVTALRQALLTGTPMIFHSDQGSQYACWDHTALLTAVGTHISMSDVGKPMQNGLVERFIRTLKEEHVDYSEYEGFEDAYRQIAHWLEVEYMTQRLHSQLGYLTPLDFEGQRFTQAPFPLLN